jgi:hypothetical protein
MQIFDLLSTVIDTVFSAIQAYTGFAGGRTQERVGGEQTAEAIRANEIAERQLALGERALRSDALKPFEIFMLVSLRKCRRFIPRS